MNKPKIINIVIVLFYLVFAKNKYYYYNINKNNSYHTDSDIRYRHEMKTYLIYSIASSNYFRNSKHVSTINRS